MIGTTLGHYHILERLGAGGMGEVYRARDQTLGRDVALKVLPAELAADEASRARLLREARMASSLSHPNVCTIYDVGEAKGRLFMTMELVPGRVLADAIPPHGLHTDAVIDYGIQVAAALAHAHERGVIHRDLKTGNVVITPEGLAKVLDFGLARHAESGRTLLAEPSTVTDAGSVVGTAQYLAPELLRGARADERSDIWALGVVLYEMATGTAPFRGRTEFELSAAILNAPPAPLPDSLPAGLRAVITRSLAKEPTQRFRRAGEVRAALEGVLAGGAAVGRSAVALGRPTAVIRGRRLAWRLVPVGVAALLALAWSLDVGGLRGRFLAGRAAIRSLAVLPLENLSRDPEQDYFVDGMTEELITSLANLEGVSVISRTSAMRYKGTRKSIPQIARELGVDAVVEGSALRAGGRVRITAQLIHGSADRHVWARSYERDLRDILALQGEVAAAIAGEIRAALTARGKSRATHAPAVDPQSYEDYLKGRFYWAKRDPGSLRKAEEFFRRAITRDPKDAAAHAGLADVYAVLSPYANLPASSTFPQAREAVLKALELDDQLAEAHATLALIRYQYEHDWVGAASEFRKALALNPSYATAHQWYGLYLAHMGELSEGLAELDRAQDLDPLSPAIRQNRGNVLYWQRRFEEAAAVFRQALELDPGFREAHRAQARNLLARKAYASALAEFDQSDSIMVALHRDKTVRDALSRGDERAYWRLQLRWTQEHAPRRYSAFLECYAQLGERDSALAWLERGFEQRDVRMLFLLRSVALDPIRSDPRFASILRRYGLEP